MNLRHYSESIGTATEVLVVRGLLTDDLQFQPVFCGSEFRRPDLAKSGDSDIELALLDEADRILITAPAGIRKTIECSPHNPRACLLEGSIPFRPGAQRLTIRKGQVEVAKLEIGGRPKIRVIWSEKKVTSAGKYILGLDYSKPSPDALVKIFFQWGPEQYLLASAVKPAPEIALSFGDMPGGNRCGLIVAYTSSRRTAVARTKPFQLTLLEPKVEIVRPRADQVFAAWHPVELQGKVRDRQRGDVPPQECVWILDGKEIGRGLLVYGGFLEPGLYEAYLRYGKTQQSVKFQVAKEEK
jgi:hypothetical protein